MKKKSPQEIAEDVHRSLAIDRRFVVFEWTIGRGAQADLIRFTVSSEYAADGITKYFSTPAHARLCRHSIVQIPKEERYALARVGVAQVMASATYRSEQVTQMLLGEGADILDAEGAEWVRVRLHADGYIGWVNRKQIAEVTLGDMIDWIGSEKATPRRFVVPLRSKPDKDSDPAGEFLFGTYLPVIGKNKKFTELLLPGGASVWAETAALARPARIPELLSSERIVETARMFLGVPYVWGGRSVKGFDCSGFTQTVFRLNGIELPRDASLQWKAGTDAGKDFTKFAEGDLLFFGPSKKRITHVALSLGGDQFIHESGDVHCSSLDPKHAGYSPHYAKTFQGARRLGVVDTD